MDSRSDRHGSGNYAQLPESNDAIVSRIAQQDEVPWYRKPNLRSLYLLMFPTCLGAEITAGFDQSMVNALQAVPSWLEYYNHPRSALLGLVAAAYVVGAFVSAPFVPFVCDKFGRRQSILVGSIVSIIGGILQGAAVNLTMFIIARFISGFGIIFAVVAAFSLIGELSHPKERAVLGSLSNTFYLLGTVASAGVTLGTFAMPNNWAWRIPSFLQVVPSLLQATFILFLPESPRWLISKGRKDEAHAILVRYHAEGNGDSEFVKAEYTQIEKTLESELKNAQMSQKDVLSTPGMRKRIIVAIFLALFTQWSGVGLIIQFLPLILDSIGIHDHRTMNIINMTKFSWSLVTGTLFAFIVPRYPRRKIYLACTISLLVFFIAWTVASAEYSRTHSKLSSQVALALIFLYSPAFNMGFLALNGTFLIELFPFHVRAWGLAAFQWWSCGAAFFNQFVNPIGMDAAGWKWYISYCVWMAFEVAFVYFVFPETAGRTLEELTFLYEDDRRQEEPSHADVEIPRDPVGTETRDALEASLTETVLIQHGDCGDGAAFSNRRKRISMA